MNTIYKYPVTVSDQVVMRLPEDAEILTIQTQRGSPFLWALVDSEAETESRYLKIFGTGHPVGKTDDLIYVGTFQLLGGDLVFHAFEDLGRLREDRGESQPSVQRETDKGSDLEF